MKRCPTCNRTYADETLSYCLDDGALLSAPYDSEATQTLPATLGLPLPTEPSYKQPSRVAGRSGRNFNSSHVIILVMAVLLTASAMALFYEKRKGPSNSNVAESSATPSNTAASQQNANNPANSPVPEASVNPARTSVENRARFSLNSCGSIRDSRTGLEWYVGPDRNMTWHEAKQWTAGLNVCGGGWRMPSVEEIRTLYDPASKAGTGFYLDGKYYPAHIDPVFNGIGGGSWVWSSEKAGEDNARSFNLNQGKPVAYSTMNTYYSTRAFAVRNARY